MNAEPVVLRNRPSWARDGSAISVRCDGDWHQAEAALKEAAGDRTIMEIAHVTADNASAVFARLA